jgi:ferritin
MFFVHNRFFKESSEEEREHAEKLMKYQVGVTL